MKCVVALFVVFVLLSVSLAFADTRPVTRVFSLPNNRAFADYLGPMAIVAGEPPGIRHARGTIFVVESEIGKANATISEWDIASGSQIRSAEIPVPTTNRVMDLVHAGGQFHLVTSVHFNARLSYIRLGSDFHVEEVFTLGFGETACIATDGSLVAIEWSEVLDPEAVHHRFHLLTLEASGRRIASTILLRSAPHQLLDMFVVPLAVLDGKIFTFVWDPNQPLTTPRVLVRRLSADGQTETEKRLDLAPESGSLEPVAGHLLLMAGYCHATIWDADFVELDYPKKPLYRDPSGYYQCPPFKIAAAADGRLLSSHGDVLSPQLQVVAHFADVPRGLWGLRPIWVGAEPVLLEATATGRTSIVWAECDPGAIP